jgi:murein L,D-transpeptidase YafK
MIHMNEYALIRPLRSILGLLILIGMSVPGHANDEVWLLVDTKSKVLRVKQGVETKAEYNNISIGQNGTAADKVRGDDKTPLGIYRIGWVNYNSRFYRFYGFNYPSRMDAQRGLKKGLIDTKTFQRIFNADLLDQIPDQNTALGGQIGIHGIGRADASIHKSMNWTRGCIALTNNQINSLGAWIKTGTVVVIR